MRRASYTLMIVPELKGRTRKLIIHRSTLISMTILFTLLMACTIMFIVQNTRYVELQYQYQALQIQKRTQDDTVDRLQKKIKGCLHVPSPAL